MLRLGYKLIETNSLFQRLIIAKKFTKKALTQTQKPTPYQKENPRLTRFFRKQRQETDNIPEEKISQEINE